MANAAGRRSNCSQRWSGLIGAVLISLGSETASAQPGYRGMPEAEEQRRQEQIVVMLKTNDYEALEARYAVLNTPGRRDRHGETEAVAFVFTAQQYLAKKLRDRTSEGEAFINGWKATHRGSDLARLVQTRAYVEYAAKHAGKPYAGMYAPALLRMTEAIYDGNPHWPEAHAAASELRIMSTVVRTMDEGAINDAIRTAMSYHPEDEFVVYPALLYAEGDSVEAAAQIVAETAGDAGYARVHRFASYIGPEFYGPERITELSDHWDWERLRRGAEAILSEFPTKKNVTEFSRLAVAAEDMEFLSFASSIAPPLDGDDGTQSEPPADTDPAAVVIANQI